MFRRFFYVVILVALLLSGCATRATTESQGSRLSDVVELAPNQTAFVIPAVAGNLSGQTKFDSIDYLESVKVPAKRITIDKELVGGAYYPKDFVYLVDRTPVALEWTLDDTTGTKGKNQALCGETNESIQVCFQISMAAQVTEDQAATYLYFYPAAKLQNANIGGVYVNTPLSEVVDTQIRPYVLAIIGREIKSRSLADVILHTNDIIKTAQDETAEYFAGKGITLAYLGMGGELGLSPEIQLVINQMYVAKQQQEIAKIQATTMAINADAERQAILLKGQGDADAMKLLLAAVGGDLKNLGPALESYRWDGVRLTVSLAPTTPTAYPIPLPTEAPAAPTPVIVATPTE